MDFRKISEEVRENNHELELRTIIFEGVAYGAVSVGLRFGEISVLATAVRAGEQEEVVLGKDAARWLRERGLPERLVNYLLSP